MCRVVVILATVLLFASSADGYGQVRNQLAVTSEIRAMIAAGRADSAIMVAEAGLARDSADVDLLLALADAYKADGQYRQRRVTLHRILKVQPTSVSARISIAEDFFSARQFDSAAYFAHAALAMSDNRSADACYWLGRTHLQAERADSALYYFRAAWRAIPSGDLF